ncbi:MAG: hypothetical protein ACREQ5_00240 [Candidatus Dormibacteria bacterium]
MLTLGTLFAAPASAVSGSSQCAEDTVTVNDALNTYQADKLQGASTTQLDQDVANLTAARARSRGDGCDGTPRHPNPVPIATVGTYPIPHTPGERDHLLQVCKDRNSPLLGLTATVLAQDCQGAVPPCPPKPCNCPPPPAPPTDTPPAPVVVPGPVVQGPPTFVPGPVVQGPNTEVPGPVVQGPDTFTTPQAPTGPVETGATTQADRYLG